MSQLRSRLAPAVALALGVYACGGSVVLPDESIPEGIVVVGGDGQAAPAGTTLSEALVVQVTDTRDRPVADQEVVFTVEAGGGEILPASVRTNESGQASAAWTLGPGAGAQRVRAHANGNGAPADLEVMFTATALAGSGQSLVLVSGDGQAGQVGTELGSPLVVRAVDELGNPVSGVTINWTVTGGGGSVDPATAVTGDDGEASATRVLGPGAGEQTTQASAEGLSGSPVTFTHTAGASSPDRLVRVSGDAQTAPAGFQLPDSLVVRLLDANDNGVAGRTVTWVVPQGAGVVSQVNTTTDEDGFAYTRWTLGSNVGSYTINAVFSGLPSVPFAATATADAPTTLAIFSGDGQTAPGGTTLPQPLRVRVTDANGNSVANVSVTWEAVGGGSISSTTTGTNSQGIAEVTRTLGPTPGQYTTTATVPGLSGSPVTFTSTAEVGVPDRLVFLTQPTGALVGQPLPSFQVEIQDAQGNRVTTATNQVTINSVPGGNTTGDNSESAVDGVATFAALALEEARTGYRLTANASGLSSATSDLFDVGKGGTTIVITGKSRATSVTGQSVRFDYNVDVVAPAAGTLDGTVTVTDGTQSCTDTPSGTGTGSCSIEFATAGARTMTASYADDPNFDGSTSAGLAHTVNKANASVTITNDQPDPSAIGEDVLVEYTVTGGGAAPTGTVTITVSGGDETCSGAAADGSCTVNLETPGSRTLTATYSGDDNYNGDTDGEGHSVRIATTTTITSGGNTVFGQSAAFMATVAPVPPGSGTPGGTVQFRADGVDLGGPVSLSGGIASQTTSALSVGSHAITAEYLPSGATFAASSGTLSPDHVVGKALTATSILEADPEPSNPNQSYSVLVRVQAVAPGGGTPGGSVTISDGEGGSCVANLAGGEGSCSLSTATAGAKTLTAAYGGDANFESGSSDTAPHQVNNPPVAEPDTYSVILLLGEAAPGVLGNDTDADGDNLTAEPVTLPSNGQLDLNPNGGFLYTPNPLFTGEDSFTYRASDGSAFSAPVTVTLQVGP